jgi:hypothetical protein
MSDEKTFRVSITGDHILSTGDIWPDGDAPENPTADDVAEVMRNASSTPERLCLDWGLDITIAVDGIDVDFDGF